MASANQKKAEDPVKAALTNHIVLRRIFSNLKLRDLKACRLVNKFWESEVGSHIRRFRRCSVHIPSPFRDPRRCADVKALATIISETTFVPIINSVTVSFWEGHDEDHCESQWNEESNAIDELTKKISLRYLEIHGAGGSEMNVGGLQCPAVQFVVKLFRDKLTDVIELSFNEFPGSNETYFEDDWDPALPNLKVLRVGTTDFEFKSIRSVQRFMAKILRVAPNLQKLKADTDTSRFLEILPKERYPMLDSFGLYVVSDEQEKYCLELAKAEPKLLSLSVRIPPSSERRYTESCLTIAEELMTSSQESLKELEVILVNIPTEFLSFPPMVHLKKLKISGENDLPLHQFLAMLRAIDYSKMLPSLASVCVNVSTDLEEIQDPQQNDDGAVVVVHRATSVQELDVVADFTELTFQDLSTIFPKLRSLRASVPWWETQGPVPYDDLFASWPQLEFLYVSEGEEGFRRNFDSQFLGIHPEEVEILRELDDESLEKMHIVPIRPSLLTMLCLRSVDFYISARDATAGELSPDQVFLSRLTGIIALKKMMRTGIEIRFRCFRDDGRLNHLRPFASEDRGPRSLIRFLGGM